MSGVGFWSAAGGATELDDLTDVDTTTTAPTTDDLLRFDGTNWVPVAESDVVQNAGRWEVLVDESEEAVSNGSGDWLYVWVT